MIDDRIANEDTVDSMIVETGRKEGGARLS